MGYFERFLLFSFLLMAGCSLMNRSWAQGVDDSPVLVNSNFDGGSMGALRQVAKNSLKGVTIHWKQRNGSGDQYYWFQFQLKNTKNKEIEIELDSLIGTYRGEPHIIYNNDTRPVFSYDLKNWSRVTDVSYHEKQHSFTFKQFFDEDSVWIAYSIPYSYKHAVNFWNSVSHNRFIKQDTIAYSGEKRPVRLLTITDEKVPSKKKRVIFISTLQHGSETSGGFIVEGLIKFLISDSGEAKAARRNFIYKIVPMVNPDGVYGGITRYNADGVDLNQSWMKESEGYSEPPEVRGIRNWINDFCDHGRKIDLALDVHSWSQQGTTNNLHTPAEVGELAAFSALLRDYFPINYIPHQFPGSLSDFLVKEKKIPGGTMEFTEAHLPRKPYVTIDDYYYYGKAIVLAINNTFGYR